MLELLSPPPAGGECGDRVPSVPAAARQLPNVVTTMSLSTIWHASAEISPAPAADSSVQVQQQEVAARRAAVVHAAEQPRYWLLYQRRNVNASHAARGCRHAPVKVGISSNKTNALKRGWQWLAVGRFSPARVRKSCMFQRSPRTAFRHAAAEAVLFCFSPPPAMPHRRGLRIRQECSRSRKSCRQNALEVSPSAGRISAQMVVCWLEGGGRA